MCKSVWTVCDSQCLFAHFNTCPCRLFSTLYGCMRTRNVPHPGVLRIGKVSHFTTLALGICIALEYTAIFCLLHVVQPLCHVEFAHIDSSCRDIAISALSTLLKTHNFLQFDSTSTTMRCLLCFWFSYLRPNRSKRLRRSAEPCSNASPHSIHPQKPEPTHRQLQTQTQSLQQTPSPRLLPSASDSPSSTTSGSTVRAVPLADPFVAEPASFSTTRQSRHITAFQHRLEASVGLSATRSSPLTPPRDCKANNTYGPIIALRSHDDRMARSRTRQPGPQSREDSPTSPLVRTSNASFSARIARLPTQGSYTAQMMLQQSTFLDNDSSTSDYDASHHHDDSGYVSIPNTPTKPQHPKIGSATTPAIQSILSPAPLVFQTSPVAPSALLDTSQSPQSQAVESLCDQRHCLRHKQTCLEHDRNSTLAMHPSRIPKPTTQDRRLRRRPRVLESQSYEQDVWMHIAPEYVPGS